jgi:hypothetical protein
MLVLPVRLAQCDGVWRGNIVDAHAAPDRAFVKEADMLNSPDHPRRTVDEQVQHRQPAYLAVRQITPASGITRPRMDVARNGEPTGHQQAGIGWSSAISGRIDHARYLVIDVPCHGGDSWLYLLLGFGSAARMTALE